jgi:hypothetical protein
MLPQAFYSVRSERQLMERLDTDLLFRWFVGLNIDDAVWDATVFSKNRDRLLDGAIAAKFLAAVLAQPRVTRLGVPYDRGFVSGLPHSRDEHRSGDRLITGWEDSPPWSCLRQCRRRPGVGIACTAGPVLSTQCPE